MNIILITGATSGIGKATALKFARSESCHLLLCGRRIDRLTELAGIIHDETESHVSCFAFDIRSNEACIRFWEQLPGDLKAIDILVNNAGLAKGLSEIQEGATDHWDQMIDTNVKGLLYITRLVTPGMVARRNGHIINLCSIAGKEAYPKGNVYNASKFAIDGLTKAMRMDLFKYNIRVASISPGAVEETEFALVRFDGDREKAAIYEGYQPLKSSDVANIIYFMAMQPAHVMIQDVVVTATQQGSATMIDRSGR